MKLLKLRKLYDELSTIECDNIMLDIELDTELYKRNIERVINLSRQINQLSRFMELNAIGNLIAVDFVNRRRA
jgi:hypothetical protein